MAGVHAKILQVMRNVGAIKKTQTNKFDHYNFRGIEDVYNVLGPEFAKVGLFVTPHVEEIRTDVLTTGKGAQMYRTIVRARYVFHDAEDGSTVETMVVGEGADRGDKSANKAMSAAFKVAMFQALCIPTADQLDSESESPEHDAPEKKAKEPEPVADDPHAEITKQYGKEAAARAVECGMEPKSGVIVLVDAMRAAGVADASAQNWRGKLVTAYEEDEGGFGEHLSIEIEKWAPKSDAVQAAVDAGFELEGGEA